MRCEVSEIVDSDAPPPTLPMPKADAYDDDDDDDDDADAAPSPAPAPPVLQKREPGVLKAELAVLAALETVAAMQEEGQEDVRFSQEAVKKLGARSGTGTGSLWGVVELWKNFLDARAQAARRAGVVPDQFSALYSFSSFVGAYLFGEYLVVSPSLERRRAARCRRRCRRAS